MNIKKEHRPPEMQQEMEKILKELDDCTKKITNATEHLRVLAAKDSEQNFIAKYLQNGDDDIMYKALKIVLKVCIGLSPTSQCACRAYKENRADHLQSTLFE